MRGLVTFVGAGCGDPRLITVRAAELLDHADVVVFDPEVHPDILARAGEGVARIAVTTMMTPEMIGSLLASHARDGKAVVRLMWADPLFFGLGDAEGVAVARHGIPIEFVPGIGPLVAIGAFAGVPLTRSQDASPSVAAVSVTRGHEGLHDWSKLSTATDTLAIVVDAESVPETARSLVFYGRDPHERVTLIESVSLPSQTVMETTLGQIPQLPPAKSPRVVLVVGERATRTSELAWLEKQPLFGKRILVTRAREQAGEAGLMLRARGADPFLMPTIEIHPPSDPAPMIEALESVGERYAWVVFTSANGVDRTWAEIRREGKDARVFGRAKIAVIGPGTAAALEKCGIVADLIAKEHRGEALADEILAAMGAHGGAKGTRVLLARAEVARDVLPDALRAAGCIVDVVAVYKTRTPPRPLLDGLTALLDAGEIDVVTFTSSSTVEHLCDALGAGAAEALSKTCVASIGPITTQTAEKRGVRVDVTATEYTMVGLVAALEDYFVRHAPSEPPPESKQT